MPNYPARDRFSNQGRFMDEERQRMGERNRDFSPRGRRQAYPYGEGWDDDYDFERRSSARSTSFPNQHGISSSTQDYYYDDDPYGRRMSDDWRSTDQEFGQDYEQGYELEDQPWESQRGEQRSSSGRRERRRRPYYSEGRYGRQPGWRSTGGLYSSSTPMSQHGPSEDWNPERQYNYQQSQQNFRSRSTGNERDFGGQRSESYGRYYGRGPQGYSRSDERIKEEVCDALMRNGEIDAEQINVRVENGEITLTGSVEGKYMRRLVEDVCEDILGVKEVHNQLRTSGMSSSSMERMSSTGNGSSTGTSGGSRAASGSTQGSQSNQSRS